MDPQAHPRAALARRDLEHRYRAQGRPDLGFHPHGPPRHRDRAQGRGGRPAAQGHRALHEEARRREGRGHEPGRERVAPRDRRRPVGAGRCRAARGPRRVPPRHEARRADRDARRRHGRPGAGRRTAGWHRDVAPRVVPRGPRAVAHAPREGRLRHGRGEDHVRRDRREGLGLSRRPDPRSRAGDRARARARSGGHPRSCRRAARPLLRPPRPHRRRPWPWRSRPLWRSPWWRSPSRRLRRRLRPTLPSRLRPTEAPAPEAPAVEAEAPAAEAPPEAPSGDDA